MRYEKMSLFARAEGVVRPTIRRVLGHMRASGVLATSKAATRSPAAARRQSEVSLVMMRKYATLLGEDVEVADTLSETEALLRQVAEPRAETSDVLKDSTGVAMRLHRGTKDFAKA